jgi:hypothetical protein
VDGAGHPHISYWNASNDNLKYAHHNGMAWSTVTVDGDISTDVGRYTSIAVDGAGHVHISYHDGTNQDLKYAYHGGTAWTTYTLDGDSSTHVGEYTSIDLDDSDHPRISYWDETNDRIKLATYVVPKPGTPYWTKEPVESSTLSPQSTAIVAEGRAIYSIYVAYLKDHKHMRVATKTSSNPSWGYSTVDRTSSIGDYASVAVDSMGRPHISYRDWYGKNLKYAHWDGSAWNKEIVGPGEDAGYFTSIAVDGAGKPHISYLIHPNDHLKYAHWNGAAWQFATVDASGDVDYDSSIAVDSQNRPHIAYFDSSNEALRYAHYNGASWQTEPVETGSVGEYPSIALDKFDRPHISYYDIGDHDLKYAHYDGSAWQIQTVDDPAVSDSTSVGRFTSIAVDRAGRPHVTYWDYDEGVVKYARWDGTAWQIEVAVPGMDPYWPDYGYAPLALDFCDSPHIVYKDYALPVGRLRYAYKVGATWQYETIGEIALDPEMLSNGLALGRSGKLHVAFHDYLNEDLGYAVGQAKGPKCGRALTPLFLLLLE